MHISLVIPAYNEAERIGPTLETLQEFFAGRPEYQPEVLVVSDGSTDGTDDIVRSYADTIRYLRLVAYQPNRGKGYAVRRGMLEATGEVRVLCDADLSTPISELPRFLTFYNGQRRVVIASRALPSSRIIGWHPEHRHYGGVAFNRLVQAFAVPGCWDTQCGFKLFSGDAAVEIFGRSVCNGFAYDVEVLAIAQHLGYDIFELGIRWENDPATKVRVMRDFLPAFLDVIAIAFRQRRGYYDVPIGDV